MKNYDVKFNCSACLVKFIMFGVPLVGGAFAIYKLITNHPEFQQPIINILGTLIILLLIRALMRLRHAKK